LPGPREGPTSFHRSRGHFKSRGCLLDAQAAEEPQPRDGRLVGRLSLQATEHFIEPHDFLGIAARQGREILEVRRRPLPPTRAATLDTGPSCGVVQADSPHRVRRGSIEVAPARPLHLAGSDQFQVRLVNQGGGAERVVAALRGHLVLGRHAELFVNQGEQTLGGVVVTIRRGGEQECGIFGVGGRERHGWMVMRYAV